MSQSQQPVKHTVQNTAVQQWVVVGKTNSCVSYYQTDGGQATRDVGGRVAA